MRFRHAVWLLLLTGCATWQATDAWQVGGWASPGRLRVMTTNGDTLPADTIHIAWDSTQWGRQWDDSVQVILIDGSRTTRIPRSRVVRIEEKRVDDGMGEMLVVAGAGVLMLLGLALLHALHLK